MLCLPQNDGLGLRRVPDEVHEDRLSFSQRIAHAWQSGRHQFLCPIRKSRDVNKAAFLGMWSMNKVFD
jgi:hypothetical protein